MKPLARGQARVTGRGTIGQPDQAAQLGDAKQDKHRQPDQSTADGHGPSTT